MKQPSTLTELLRIRAEETPDRILYTFVGGTAGDDVSLTYGDLQRRATAVASLLRTRLAPGERALLLYPPGLDYIVGFWGALCAGVIAVPAYPPDPGRLARTLPRLEAIIADCGAGVVLTTEAVCQLAGPLGKQSEVLGRCSWMSTDWALDGEDGAADGASPDDVAFLQYTSGSTGAPKGVVLTHANLIANSQVIASAFDTGPRHRAVLWLPPYHDMGLIGGIVQPLFGRFPVTLMSPLAFLKRPLRWLEAITRDRATIAGGPNFAFELCVRKSTAEQRAALDLRTWEFAFTGAERVRAGTLERFATAFAESGFRPRAFYPCYGLAEATLIVTGAARASGAVIGSYSRDALARDKVQPTPDGGPEALKLVSSGRPLPGVEVRVVDPDALRPTSDDAIGEIWVAGPSVARGYWNRPELSEATFAAHLEDGAGPYLRTGDLGFLHDGELYVTGRRKDLIILHGRNCFPDDLERTAETAHPALRPGCGAAFSVDTGGEERVVVVHEIDLRRRHDAPDELSGVPELASVAAAVRSALARVHEVAAYAVVLVPAGTVSKTSSGKIQRFAVREQFLAGLLPELAQWREEELTDRAAAPVTGARDGGEPGDVVVTERPLVWLQHALARRTSVPVDQISADTQIGSLGLVSISAMDLLADIEARFGIAVSLATLVGATPVGAVADLIERSEAAGAPESRHSKSVVAPRARLARGQQALWLLYELAPHSNAYNLARMFRLTGAPDERAFRRALAEVVARHPVLAARFGVDGEGPFQDLESAAPVDVRAEDARGWPEAQLASYLEEAALLPLPLREGGPLRIRLLHTGSHQTLLVFVAHHLVMDLWSMGVVLEELGQAYGAFARGETPAWGPAAPDYRSFVDWQRELLATPRGEELRSYWKRTLADAPALSAFPRDVRPAAPGGQGGGRRVRAFGAQLTDSVRRLARESSVTPFSVLLAAVALVLHRYTGEDDLVIGCPASGRVRAWQRHLVGYLSNVLPIRIDLSGDPSARELIDRVMRATFGALSHQELPFVDIVRTARPTGEGDDRPFVGVLFSCQDVDRADLGPVAINLGHHPCKLGELRAETVVAPTARPTFDLTISVADCGGELVAAVEYDVRIHDASTAQAIADNWIACVEEMTREPSQPMSRIRAIGDGDRRLLESWTRGPRPLSAVVLADEAVRTHAERDGSRPAVRAPDGVLTYAELEARTEALAGRLRTLGVGPEVLVGVCLERSCDLLVALLAVARAGGAYLPLDPAYPAARLERIVSDAGIELVLAMEGVCGPWIGDRSVVLLDGPSDMAHAHESSAPPAGSAAADALAYVIYTSGSTGGPKGVEVTRRALANFLASMRKTPGVSPDDRMLAVTTISFDIAALELYLPLLAGGTVVIASRAAAQDGRALAKLLADERITIMQATPLTWRLLLKADWRPSGRFVALCGGEALPPDLMRALVDRGCTLFNLYGPTETTVWSTLAALSDPDAPIHIGTAIDHTEVHVLDRRMQPVPVGAEGELYIGGCGLARAYRGRGDLTAERFVPHPTGRGERLYRTGDRCRFRGDGTLQYRQRTDQQIKLHGFRIEVAEVEAALLRHPAVAQAAVVAVGDDVADRRLVGYVVVPGDCATDEIAALAGQTLPAYMVPAEIVPVASLPTTPNGKVDRRALASQPRAAPRRRRYRAPNSDLERALCEIWGAVFPDRELGVDDDFFGLGGHSLLAMDLVGRIRHRLEVDLPVGAIFEARTIAALAARLTETSSSSAVPTRIPRASAGLDAPLSFAQRWMWILGQIYEGPAYHMSGAFRITGALDVVALERALAAVVARHETLAMVVEKRGGEPVQIPIPDYVHRLSVVNVGGEPAARAEEVVRRAAEESSRPFALDRGPLFRTTLFRLAPEEHVLVVVLHHIVADGQSLGLLAREVAALYASARSGQPFSLPPLPLRYRDYAIWQRSTERALELQSQLAYWRERLVGVPPLDLATDKVRPPVQSLRGCAHTAVLGADLIGELSALGEGGGATLFMTLLAAFTAFLHRHSGQTDICVGTPISTRSDPALSDLIGLFINTVVIRTQLSSATSFEALLADVRRSVLEAFENRDLQYEQLVEELRPARDTSRTPLFQVTFALEQAEDAVPRLADVTVQQLALPAATAKTDLSVTASIGAGGLSVRWEYSTDLFEPDTVADMAARFETLLRQVAARPLRPIGDLEILSTQEVDRLIKDVNDTGHPFPHETCIHELVGRWIGETPDAPAVACGTETLSYADLGRRAAALAHRLSARGVTTESLVGLCLERSPDLIVAMLAVLQADAAYVMLDPVYPAERLAVIREDAGARVVVTRHGLEALVRGPDHELLYVDDDHHALGADGASTAGWRGPLRPATACSSNLAYLLYTSGSTGAPKGIAISHRSVARLVFGNCGVVGPGDRFAQLCASSFDAAPFEIWSALCRGATCVIIDGETILSPPRLALELSTRRITALLLPTALFNLVARTTPTAFEATTHVFFGGEAADPAAVTAVLGARAPVHLVNAYGPAESTTLATVAPLRPGGEFSRIPIGRPISNTEVYVVDRNLRCVPPGTVGELYIGGEGLARGYWGLPGLTAERFLPNPFGHGHGARLYRTGDLVRQRRDGQLEFICRSDDQLKVRGFRVEPNEVAALLSSDPAVREAVVLGRVDATLGTYLAAYLVLRAHADMEQVIARLRARVPEFMVPAAVVVLAALPLTPNGKVDTRALPAARPERRRPFVAPASPTERAAVRIISEVLGADAVGVDDSFFDIGGHSLLATQVASRLGDAVGKRVPIKLLFEARTIRVLAARIDEGSPAERSSSIGRAPRRVLRVDGTATTSESGAKDAEETE